MNVPCVGEFATVAPHAAAIQLKSERAWILSHSFLPITTLILSPSQVKIRSCSDLRRYSRLPRPGAP